MKHTIQVHMTNQCNLKCEYCYIKQNGLSLTREMFEKQIDKVEELSYRLNGNQDYEYDVTYFGGEPLMKLDNVLEFDKYICSKLKVSHKFMQTNGILLNKNVKKQLENAKINIGISCDGKNDPNHKSIEKIYQEHIVDMQPKMMIDGYNVDKMMDNIKYFFDIAVGTQQNNFYIDASFVRDKVWNDTSIEELKKQLDELNEFILWVYKTYNYYLKIGFIDRTLQNIVNGKRDFICFAGSSGFSITPTGIIYPCSRFYSNDEWRLYDSNTDEWFDDNIKYLKEHNTTVNDECNACPINKFCNQGCYCTQLKNGGIVKEYCQMKKIVFNRVSKLYGIFRKLYNINISK